MKKLLLSVLFISGCSSPTMSVLKNIFTFPRGYPNYYNYSQYINRYNVLQNGKKKLAVEFEECKKDNILSESEEKKRLSK